MGTTPRGIAFPDDDSPIENLQDDLAQLAATADAAINDVVAGTAWVELTTTSPGDMTAAYKIAGGFCSIRISGVIASVGSGAWETIVAAGDLPASARPDSGASGAAWAGAQVGGITGLVTVRYDGSILLRQDSGASRTGAFGATLTYPIA